MSDVQQAILVLCSGPIALSFFGVIVFAAEAIRQVKGRKC